MRIRKPSRRAAITALILAALAGDAAARQMACLPVKAMHDLLGGAHGEAPVSRAISGRALIETWVNPQTRSCSLVMTLPDGRACLVAACEDWEALPYRAPKAGEDM